MNKSPVVLTISILISNRPDTVKKCLDSVKPLLENLPSELILVDTGCGEEVRKMIGEYTDHIIPFEWCRDFSKARNAGLREAKGEWFLYLDDDEWFEDVGDIIRFFRSGEYRAYGVGLYIQRNYLVQDGSEYTELVVGRIIRLEPDIRFIHRVHECFNRAPGLPKKLDAYVHHYGYIYENPQEQEAHARRNISLLKEEMAEDPDSIRNAMQLVQEYNAIGDRTTSLSLSRESIARAEKEPNEEECCLPSLYANEINCYIELQRYEEAIDRGELHLKNSRIDKMAKALIAGQLTVAYLEKGQYARCLERVTYYWETYQDYLKNDEEYMEYNMPITNTCFHPRRQSLVLGNGVRAAISLGKDALAWQWFQRMEWEKGRGYADIPMVHEILERMWKTGEKEWGIYREMCDILLSREGWEEYLLQEIREICEKAEPFSERIRIAAAYRNIDSRHWFMKLLRLSVAAFLQDREAADTYKEENGTAESVSALYAAERMEDSSARTAGRAGDSGEAVIERTQGYTAEAAEQLEGELWAIMEESMPLMKAFDTPGAVKHFGGDNGQVLEKIPFSRWERGITWYFSRFSWRDAAWWSQRFQAALEPGSIRMLAWRAAYGVSRASGAVAALERREGDTWQESGDHDSQSILEGLREYADSRTALCQRIYREEIIRKMPDILPEEDRGAYAVLKLLEHTEKGNYSEAIAVVKEINTLLPGLSNIMKQYLKWLERQMKRRQEESRQAAGEFQMLAAQIKVRIKNLAQAGQYQAALAVMEQIETLLPGDREIQQMKEEISKMC